MITTKDEWMKMNGFKNNFTTMIIGNTYDAKDELKEAGATFNKLLKWHTSESHKSVFSNFIKVQIKFDDVYDWDETQKTVFIKPKAPKLLKKLIEAAYPIQEGSEFVGAIGERLRNLDVTLVRRGQFVGNYGLTFIYTFDYNGQELTWMTQKDLELQVGDSVSLTGTVVKHETYMGKKTTKVNRCIIK